MDRTELKQITDLWISRGGVKCAENLVVAGPAVVPAVFYTKALVETIRTANPPVA
jgi:hypothetical protein